uniref:Cupin type-2 domain-containing protein n=1 Tax=Davidia involucrata TaxID=16924 RepID=A0A5B6YLK1_DAVIN
MAEDTNRRLKIIAGADSFGCTLKDALVAHLRSLNIDVEDLGTDKYYSVGEEIGRRVSSAASNSNPTPIETRGLVACGTGVGVSIFANKFPGVYAATCLTAGDAQNTRSINNCNVLAVSGMSTSPESAIEILETWLNTPFRSPCPASDSKPWPPEIDSFLDNSISEMTKIGPEKPAISSDSCAICCLAKAREFAPVEIMPGGSMKILRETPTSAIVRFKAGSVEPAHHHTFGHDLVVMKGSKRVWNLSKGEKYDLGVGDFLFTPAGDVHRVKYFEDTEFFIKWDGHWDLLLDEDHAAANAAIEKEAN